MKKIFSISIVSAILGLASFASAANAQTYVCQLTEQGRNKLIPEVVVVAYDKADGSVAVFDPIIKYYVGEAIAGEVKTLNDKRITFGWLVKSVKGESTSGGRPLFTSGIKYRLTIQHSSLKATIWAAPNGYRNQGRGKGQCEIEQ